MPEDTRDISARLLATAALTGGVGAALYKGFKTSPGSLKRFSESVRPGSTLPRLMIETPLESKTRLLQEAFDVVEDVTSPGGRSELLRRAYERALYGAGMVSDNQRTRLVSELVNSSGTWESAQGVIAKYENQLGGFEGIYGALREITGGTISGSRRKEVSQLLRETSMARSAFEPSGQFWKERFRLQVPDVLQEIPMAPISGSSTLAKERLLSKVIGQEVNIGIRQANRPRTFSMRSEGAFKFESSIGKLSLPYSEFQIGGKGKDWFLQMPTAVEHKGINFVAADHRGMGYAAVPKFAIPVNGGTGYRKVSWNEGLRVMLYGDEGSGIEGLAEKLHKLHGDEKAMRDLTNEWNTRVRGLFHRVTGSQGNMTQALMHSESILPVDRLMAQIGGEKVKTSIEGLTEFYSKMKSSGFNIGPLAGADPMAKHYRVSLKDWGERWDIFGGNYPIERRYGSRIRPFSMTEESLEAMRQMPIGGILPRGHGITTTAIARKEIGAMPQVTAYLSLEGAKHLSPEEALVSKRLAPMMKMKTTQKFEVLADTTQAMKGEILREGAVIGVDYRTGESILAKGAAGKVEQKIVDARQVGDIVRLEVETQLPLQDQMKIFGYKVQVHVARRGMEKEVVHEYGVGKAGLKYSKDLEFVGSADLLKKIPQEISKQMAEASWLVMQKRLSEAGVIRSGGKSKIERQRIRAARGQKTYTWKGGLPKDYINMDMWMYVRDQQYRDKVLKNRQKAGARVARHLGLQGEQAALGTGLEILRYAKKHNLGEEGLSLIGGVFYKKLEEASGSPQDASRLLKEVGLTESDIGALREAKGVLAMPTMHVGGYSSFDHKWGRAGMDYRALTELKAQQWGEAGDLLVGEIARRVIPAQDLVELERAAISLTGSTEGLEGIEKITRIREAQEALGQKEFIFSYGEKDLYVPGPKARGMAQFVSEVGDVRNQELRSAYERYIRAAKATRDRPGDVANAQLNEATEYLEKKVHKNWAAAGSLRGKVVGTAGPVARRRLPDDPTQIIAKRFASITEFAEDTGQAFTVGITRETGGKIFRDLLSKASSEERAFIKAQEEAFLSGQKVTGFVWRHPTHRPQSLMPAWFELVKGKGESAQFPKLELKHGDRVLDVSMAQGMKLDYDFDHVQVGLIADEKVKVATDTLMNSRRYREQFVEGINIQTDIMKRVKEAAASGIAVKESEAYVEGLQRLVGVKLETGTISNLVGEMRAAAAFQASGHEYSIASYLLAELEEGPISSKHGLHVGEVKKHLQTFVRGEGVGVRGAMRDAWNLLFKEESFSAGKIKYSREEFIEKMPEWISASEESGQLAAYRKNVRYGAQAQKGKELERIATDQIAKAISDAQSGRGDLMAALSREMRMGPGSALSKSRTVTEGLGDISTTAFKAFKKHWKYPAVGAAIALGISSLLSGNELEMRDHNQQVTSLGMGPGTPEIPAPSMQPNRIVTSAGGSMPVGFEVRGTGDYNAQGMRALGALGYGMGASVRIRDDRGAITPEFIEKARRERYY